MLAVDRDPVLVDMIGMGMMQVSVMQIVGMSLVADGHVPAVGAVCMIVVEMRGVVAGAHLRSFPTQGAPATLRPVRAARRAAGHENHSHQRVGGA